MALGRLPTTERITDGVYAALRGALLSGDLPAGSRLSVPMLAEQLGVSRSPVREAVVRLTREGLASEQPRRGAVVASVEMEQLVDLYEVREVLEGLAAALATRRLDADVKAQLQAALDDQRRAVEKPEIDAMIDADMRFHRLIREASGNPELIRALDEVQALVRLAMLTTTLTAGQHQAIADHEAILKAMTAGDSAEAERLAREHIARLRGALTAARSDAQLTNRTSPTSLRDKGETLV